MLKFSTALLGNCRGNDGIFAFSREILFLTAGEWVANALPEELHEQTFYFRSEDTPEIEGIPSVVCNVENRYHALAQHDPVYDAENVLVIAAPIPELTERDYLRLVGSHLALGNDVTILCCDGSVNEPFAVIRDMHDKVTSIGPGEGERALHAAVFRTDVLKKALQKNTDSLYGIINAATQQHAALGVCRARRVTEIVTGVDAYVVQKKLMERINFAHIAHGVSIMSPDSTFIASDAVIGARTTILPGTIIRRGVAVGEACTIGPNALLEKCVIGDNTSVNASQVYESTIGAHTTVGPFAYIRPECTIGDHARIGDFVELKKSQIGNGTKVSHLTYIGDATVGERVNFGCGTVVVNYDGYHKYRTEIGDDCFIGCNTNLVSPVKLGDRAFTAAGATITTNVPAGALAVARARQKNLDGWNDRRREMHDKESKK